MKRLLYIICVAAAAMSFLHCPAQNNVRFGSESTDTARIDAMLVRALSQSFATPEERVAFFGAEFIGTPYAAGTIEGEPETLTVRLDSLDCTTFVETAMALAFTTGENRLSWRDFVYNLQRLRYRNGEVDGYPSRLHYICDWAVDNIHRGNIKDATNLFPHYSFVMRSIDYMTANRGKYPALADDEVYDRIRTLENGYRRHRFPYVKSNDLGSKDTKAAFHNGDVVALVSNIDNLDVTHMGIVVKETPESEPYLLHASSKDKKVELSKQQLSDFMRRNRQWIGVRVFRLAE